MDGHCASSRLGLDFDKLFQSLVVKNIALYSSSFVPFVSVALKDKEHTHRRVWTLE